MLILAAIAMQPIDLICYGGGVSRGTVTSYGTVNSGIDQATVTATHPTREGYSEQVSLHIAGDTGKIRVPDGVKPRLVYGGEKGWYELKNIKAGEDEITAKFSLNFMNSPEVRLDRITGSIHIRGKAGNFDGQCERYDPDKVERAF